MLKAGDKIYQRGFNLVRVVEKYESVWLLEDLIMGFSYEVSISGEGHPRGPVWREIGYALSSRVAILSHESPSPYAPLHLMDGFVISPVDWEQTQYPKKMMIRSVAPALLHIISEYMIPDEPLRFWMDEELLTLLSMM